MYTCMNCGFEFEEPEVVKYDPAQGMFPNPMYETYNVCPNCGCEDIEEDYEDDEDDEEEEE